MRGFYTVKVMMYQTLRNGRVTAKFYEHGYSEVQELNNKNQEEKAFKSAISNAGQKYAYHIQRRYEDIDYQYELIDSWITYVKKDKKGKRWLSQNESEYLTPAIKRRLHIEVRQENAKLRKESKITTVKKQKTMYAKRKGESLTEKKKRFKQEQEIERLRLENQRLKAKLRQQKDLRYKYLKHDKRLIRAKSKG